METTLIDFEHYIKKALFESMVKNKKPICLCSMYGSRCKKQAVHLNMCQTHKHMVPKEEPSCIFYHNHLPGEVSKNCEKCQISKFN